MVGAPAGSTLRRGRIRCAFLGYLRVVDLEALRVVDLEDFRVRPSRRHPTYQSRRSRHPLLPQLIAVSD